LKLGISIQPSQPDSLNKFRYSGTASFCEAVADMSDLRKRIAEIDNGQPVCFEPTEGGEKFWHEGVGAFYKDMVIEQCPYPAGIAGDNWLRGWMAAEFIGFCQFEWPSSL
jgi:hypothetical protein